MKLVNYTYETLDALEHFSRTYFRPNEHLFIQLFCGNTDKAILTEILHFLKKTFPKCVIIGASTAGEIKSGRIKTGTIQISFCQLEKSRAKAYYFETVNFESGQKAAATILEEDTKVCIALAHPFGEDDSEDFVEGFNTLKADMPLSGGNAADDFFFQSAFVIYEEQLFSQGIVLVTLSGKSLHVNTNYSLAWTQVGKELSITKVDKGTIYEIDHQPIQEVYQHYLGKDVIQNLPSSAMEFPFVKISDDVDVCRSLISANGDGSLTFAGHFEEGEKVRFAIGNIEAIIDRAIVMQDEINEKPSDAIFIYSCSARKLFLEKQLNYEFGLLQQIAPTAGFFTYGEFFHSHHKNQLLNVTTTVLALGESDYIITHPLGEKPALNCSTLKSLTHLVNTTQHELDVNINFLNQYKMALDECCIVSKMNLEGELTYVSEPFCEVAGYSREELLGQTHRMFRPNDADITIYTTLWKTLKAKKIWKGIVQGVDKKGKIHYLQNTVMPIFDEAGTTLEYICAHFDITDLILKEQLIEQHFKDELTGYGNREALFHRMRLDESAKLLILLNLVEFSEINDYLGYDVGDELLQQVAHFLVETFDGHPDVVFRINGDEFAILLMDQDPKSFRNVRDKVKRLIHHLEKKVFTIKGYEVVVRLNVGVAEGNTDAIYMQSHIALKEAKMEHKAVVFYDINPALKAKTEENLQVIHKIRTAIENDRIVPFFQGIYDNELRKITKYEVLMRLQEEDGSYLSPYYFLDQAKKTRLYEKLTKIMIHKSFEYLKDFEVDFSINLTKGDILSLSVKECLYEAIKKYNCAHRVILEIVESEGIENFGEITAFIHEVKKLGCRIAIDDFGTGYSNFAYLTKLEVDIIKIDGSLIKDIDTNEISAMTVETIISFAQKMGYTIVAEFVDREAIQEKLLGLHVNFSQGYLFSKPSPTISL
ncbi:EAL domain-containing protein [Sulfurospirillum halorespirans]|uniref:Putative diguanylate cyclase n=1 Tax=Sulfurospirillum halorespirans DSM 13726 TaxID=1193502 RepID=A0A1D7TGI3_9BACT|nr:EAL domain-containing protein [Sulfurospirillum halorespirans]AOO64107.1 putative diguanylate cyclase [Sulfurospirillum halorespirans DSM 13726]